MRGNVSSQDIFQQCHEHLRLAEQRRDVAVGLLVTLALAVLAVSNNDNVSQCGIRFAFTIIAVGTFILLSLYRRWKLIHLHAASVFMKLSRDDMLPSKEQARTEWKKIVKKSDSWPRWSSGDLWLLFIAVAVSAVISVPFIEDKLNNLACCKPWFSYLLASVAWLLIACIIHVSATRNLQSFPEYAWMFRGLESSDNTG
jgi:hypothetical protein